MNDLIHVTREGRGADIRPEWLDDWKAQGWEAPGEPQATTAPDREAIAKMPKDEVIDWLKAHGIEAPQGSVADLRNALIAVMFVDG